MGPLRQAAVNPMEGPKNSDPGIAPSTPHAMKYHHPLALESSVALFDLPLEQLRAYLPDRDEPADFDDFWSRTLAETREFDLAVEFTPYELPFTSVDVYDVSFAGWGGHRIGGWFLL